MKRACSTLTQNPRQRMLAGSAYSATFFTTSRAQASELVYTALRASMS
jgi:hypothetical protein